MPGRKDKSGQEDQRLQGNNDAACRAIQKITEIRTDRAGHNADRNRKNDKPPETIRQKISRCARGYDHGNDKAGPYGLQGRDRAGAQQCKKQDL